MTKWSSIIGRAAWTVVKGGEGGYWSPASEAGFLPDSGGGYGPDGIPAGATNVAFLRANEWSQAYYQFTFTAARDMVLTKLNYIARSDNIRYPGAMSYFANIRVIIDSGLGARQKRVDRRAGKLLAKQIDLLGNNWEYFGDSTWKNVTITIRPVIIKKNAIVTIRVIFEADTWLGQNWFRFYNFRIGYRAVIKRLEANFSLNNYTRSWVGARKELLPADAMHMAVRAFDADEEEVSGVVVKGYHGLSGDVPLYPMPLSLGSWGSFEQFSVLNLPGTELVKVISDDGDGPGDDANWLGFGRSYSDEVLGMILDGTTKTYPDDTGYNAEISIAEFRDEFYVKKRTPLLTFGSLPDRIRLGDSIVFNGALQDPDRPDMKDFIQGISVFVWRQKLDGSTWDQIEATQVASNGAFSKNHTMGRDDLGLNRHLGLSSDQTLQYNATTSSLQTRTIWELIQTALGLRLGRDPPFWKGDILNLISKLTVQDTLAPIVGLPVTIVGDPAGDHQGLTDTNGEYVFPKLLDVGNFSFKVQFAGTQTDFQEFTASESPIVDFSVRKQVIATILNLTLSRDPPFWQGDSLRWTAKLTQEDGSPLEGFLVTIMGDPEGDHQGITDVNGEYTFEKFLDTTGSFSIQAKFDGLTNNTDYLASTSASIPITILTQLQSGLTLRILLNGLPLSVDDPDLTVNFTIRDAITNSVLASASQQNAFVPLYPTSYPASYKIECGATYKAIPYTLAPKTATLQSAGSTQIVAFNIEISQETGAATGRINITLNIPSSSQSGAKVTITGTTNYILKVAGSHPVRIPFCKLTIYANGKEIATVRSDYKGNFAFDWTTPTTGTYQMYAAVIRPFRGQTAKSAVEIITVISA